VTVYRTWTWLTAEDFKDVDLGEDFQPAEELTLYEIHWAHGEILKWTDGTYAIEEVEEIPVHEWSEMKVSHAENGLCTADVLAHTQKATSNLKRLVLDNQAIANSGRNTALKNSIVNPRDLLDNKIGATIWMKRPDAVGQLPPPALSPLTLETLQMMKRDSEERSGMSGLAKGMNTDAVKYQNADNMIERLTTAGQRRVTMAARDFATTFLIPLSQHIVHIAMEHDTGIDHMEVAGEQVPIAPQTWKDTALDMEAAVAITPEESAEAAQKLLTMHGLISQDEDMKMLYGLPQKHAVFDMVYDLLGLSDTSKVLLPPSSPEAKQKFQQRGQQAQQQQQLQQTMAQEDIKGKQLANQGTLAQIRALESGDQREWQKFMWDRTDDLTDNMLDERKQDHAEVIDLAELRMKEGETG
jgi:hypothetical protein